MGAQKDTTHRKRQKRPLCRLLCIVLRCAPTMVSMLKHQFAQQSTLLMLGLNCSIVGIQRNPHTQSHCFINVSCSHQGSHRSIMPLVSKKRLPFSLMALDNEASLVCQLFIFFLQAKKISLAVVHFESVTCQTTRSGKPLEQAEHCR